MSSSIILNQTTSRSDWRRDNARVEGVGTFHPIRRGVCDGDAVSVQVLCSGEASNIIPSRGETVGRRDTVKQVAEQKVVSELEIEFDWSSTSLGGVECWTATCNRAE
jgi:hypothetical protein